MDWSIQQVARLAGTTSRTLRHYDDIGLLAPTRIGENGYRRYDEAALVRLQRILLLRETGMGLAQIGDVLAETVDERDALIAHLERLRQDAGLLARRIASLERTIDALTTGTPLEADDMFDGFDHTRYEQEVTERWGADAYRRGDTWWRGMTSDQRQEWTTRAAALTRDWIDAAQRGVAPDSTEARCLAERHVAWLRSIPGTPASDDDGDLEGYVRGLGDMYVADPRFARTYATDAGGTAGAEFVRDALRAYLAS